MEKEPRKILEQYRYEIYGALAGAFLGTMLVLTASGTAKDDYNPRPTILEHKGSDVTRDVNSFVDKHRVEMVVFLAGLGTAGGYIVRRVENNGSSGKE